MHHVNISDNREKGEQKQTKWKRALVLRKRRVTIGKQRERTIWSDSLETQNFNSYNKNYKPDNNKKRCLTRRRIQISLLTINQTSCRLPHQGTQNSFQSIYSFQVSFCVRLFVFLLIAVAQIHYGTAMEPLAKYLVHFWWVIVGLILHETFWRLLFEWMWFERWRFFSAW